MRSQRVFVTGATGFIGRHLVSALCRSGHDVTCLVRASSDTEALKALNAKMVDVDLFNHEAMVSAIVDHGVVYHLAAMLKTPWHKDFDVINTQGMSAIAAACAQQPTPPRLIIMSSLAAGGPSYRGETRDEDQAPEPVSRYGWAKLRGEFSAAQFADRVPMSILRPPIVFGPGDPSTLSFFRMAKAGWAFSPGLRPHRYSLIHVLDLIACLSKLAEKGECLIRPPVGHKDLLGSGLYYVSSERHLTLPELVQHAGKSMQKKRIRTIPLPLFLVWLASLFGEGLGRVTDRPTNLNLDKAKDAAAGHWQCSHLKVKAQLGVVPSNLEQRFCETSQWYESHRWL